MTTFSRSPANFTFSSLQMSRMSSRRSAIEKKRPERSSRKWPLSLDNKDNPWQGLPPPAITNFSPSTFWHSLIKSFWPSSPDAPAAVLVTLYHHIIIPFDALSFKRPQQPSNAGEHVDHQDPTPSLFLILFWLACKPRSLSLRAITKPPRWGFATQDALEGLHLLSAATRPAYGGCVA